MGVSSHLRFSETGKVVEKVRVQCARVQSCIVYGSIEFPVTSALRIYEPLHKMRSFYVQCKD